MIFEDWDEAVAANGELEGFTVCGTLLESGEPRYFLMPVTAPDAEIRARAFEIREGRAMSSYEQWALQAAERWHDAEVGQP
jgi:hypothetical protein